MKKIYSTILSMLFPAMMMAQGWPANYEGVMMQGFYWDSYSDTQWTNLESQADELSEFFKLVWIPQSGNCGGGNSMGYNDLYWFTNYNSSFGTEAQLRSLIKTFKSKGIGTIADVVINHRSSMSGTWMSFPSEEYGGVTYTMGASDICNNDDAGKTKANAEVTPTGANDSGDDFDGARDLDHSSTHVQTTVKAYLDFLLGDLGYAGFRYDMVKGYAPAYTKLYNENAKPTYSVGEYWDGNYSNLQTWVANTGNTSAAFDFALKYNLRDCCNANTNWGTKLSGSYLAYQNAYKRYAVTFVDNHDTYARGNDSETKYNILSANAFILAAPGTPCIFLPHWKTYKKDIKQMIYARNLARINNQSAITQIASSTNQYAMSTTGTDGKKVLVLMGSTTMPSTVTASDYFLIDAGNTFAYYISKDAESAWADTPSGSYDGTISVKLNAISTTSGTQIVYTTDGTTPTASSTKVADGTSIDISASSTLKAGLLAGGVVKGIITRNYTITNFQPYSITVYVKDPGWTQMNFHTWGDYRTGTTWPGTLITAKKTINGADWYYNSYDITRADDYVNFVFNQGGNTVQTVDVNRVTKDAYFEISSSKDASGHYYVTDVTDQMPTGITHVNTDAAGTNTGNIYSIDGRLVRQSATTKDATSGLSKGIYIMNGKKYAVR